MVLWHAIAEEPQLLFSRVSFKGPSAGPFVFGIQCAGMILALGNHGKVQRGIGVVVGEEGLFRAQDQMIPVCQI